MRSTLAGQFVLVQGEQRADLQRHGRRGPGLSRGTLTPACSSQSRSLLDQALGGPLAGESAPVAFFSGSNSLRR